MRHFATRGYANTIGRQSLITLSLDTRNPTQVHFLFAIASQVFFIRLTSYTRVGYVRNGAYGTHT
jgi:hypothetical protein